MNQTDTSYLTREQFIMASLLVYEKVHNTSVDKENAIAEYMSSTMSQLPAIEDDRNKFGIRPYPELPNVNFEEQKL